MIPNYGLQLTVLAVTAAAGQPPRQGSPQLKLAVMPLHLN